VEGIAEGQDLVLVLVTVLARITAGELERALVGVGPGQAEVNLVGEARLAKQLSQPSVRPSVVEVAGV